MQPIATPATPTHSNRRRRLIRPLAALALLASLVIGLTAGGGGLSPDAARAQTQTVTQITVTSISVANPAGDNADPYAPNAYLGIDDYLWFKVILSQPINKPVVTPEIQAGTYLNFRYTNRNNAQIRKAELHSITGTKDLWYRYRIEAGTSRDGNLTLATGSAMHPSLGAGTGNEFVSLSPPANGTTIAGSVKIAAGGSYQNSGFPNTESITAISQELVNPPANSTYMPGDTVTFRIKHSHRFVPSTVNTDNNALSIKVGSTTRQADLTRTFNAGDHGYADFEYTIQQPTEGGINDTDTDGIDIMTIENNHARICPENLGPSCIPPNIGYGPLDPKNTKAKARSAPIIAGVRQEQTDWSFEKGNAHSHRTIFTTSHTDTMSSRTSAPAAICPRA